MMPDTNRQPKENFRALTVQIEEVGQQIMDRQQCVHARANTLVRHLKHEMTLPTTLLLVGGVGFIVGELTRRPPKKERQAVKRDIIGARLEATPLKEAVNFVSLARRHLTLPLIWVVDAFLQEGILKGSVTNKVNMSRPRV